MIDAGEPGDERAVEIEEGADLSAGRTRLDLGDLSQGKPHGPSIGLTVGRSHCAALPFGETGVGSGTSIVNVAGALDRRRPSASTSSKPASRQRAHRSGSTIDARS
jgi:hypothetical protein